MMQEITDHEEQPKSSKGLRALPVILLVTGAIIGAATLSDYLSFETLRDNREALLAFRDQHYILSMLVFIGAYVAIVGFSLPGATLATLTGGFLFGAVWGSLFNVIGATIGATAIFLAVRLGFGQKWSAKLNDAQGPIKKIKEGIDDNQWSMLFVIRLVPVVPFFIANLLPAFMGVPLHRYVISTFFGILPAAAVFTSIGAGLGEVFASGNTPDLSLIFEPHILGPLLGLSVLAILPVLIKALRGQKEL